MAERLGMADSGRCTTVYESSRLFNEDIYKKANIDINDNYAYRMYLQSTEPEGILPEPKCSLYSYVKDFDIVTQSSNVEETDSY